MVLLRWMLSLVLILMFLFGPSSAELKPTQPPVTCKPVRLPEGTIYRLSRSDWSSECKRCWETKDHTVLARGSKLHEGMVVELNELSITLKDCQEYLRFRWQCSNEREEAICRVNCSFPLIEEVHHTQENNTVKWCLTKDFCPDKLSFVVGLVFGAICLVAVIFGSWFIMKRLKGRITRCRQEDAVQRVNGEAQREVMIMIPFLNNIQQND